MENIFTLDLVIFILVGFFTQIIDGALGMAYGVSSNSFLMGVVNWPVVIGLIVGGAIAAPLGAYLTKKIPTKVMLIVVGLLVIGLQIRTLAMIWL